MVHFSKVVTQYSSVPTFPMYVLTTRTLTFAFTSFKVTQLTRFHGHTNLPVLRTYSV